MAVLARIIALLLCAGYAVPALAQMQLAEQKIKAGMVYNFLKYTSWPESDSSAPMRVCLFGDDPFGGSLQPMQGRSVHQRSILLQSVSSPQEAVNCNLVILGQKASWPQLRAAIAGKPILTVSEIDGFTGMGGMIEFTHRGKRIQVLLNSDAVAMAQLQVEDRLLNLVTLARSQ